MGITALTSKKPVSKKLSKKTDAIVHHIIEMIDPCEIYLIGSMLQGMVHSNSDLDLVVVVATPFKRQDLSLKVLPSRPHKDVPLDLHLISKSEFDKSKDIGGIAFEGYRHGKLIYRNDPL